MFRPNGSDPLERVLRPIIEGQIRGLIKEHPEVLRGVVWHLGEVQDPERTLIGSITKRIIGDLLSVGTRRRLAAALESATGE